MRTTGDTYISPIEIIDQYSVDVGEKYRTGIYSTAKKHLDEAKDFIERREDKDKIVVEVLPLSNYVRSARGISASFKTASGGLQLLSYPG